MEENAYLGSAAAGLVYLVLGIRLIRLGIRTRSASEWLLGATFLAWTLTYVLWVLAISLQNQPVLKSQLLIAMRIVNNLGNIGIAYFPILAFRRESTWARWLFAGIALCVIAGTAGSSWAGDPEGTDPLATFWWWIEWIGEIAPAIWIGVEGLHLYGMSRPRVRLGLCEPIVCHNFLLWGIAGVFWTLLEFVVVCQYVEFWANRYWSAAMDGLVGFFEVAALAMIWLAFFAPVSYQRRINASAATA